jgi:hypothetical protein
MLANWLQFSAATEEKTMREVSRSVWKMAAAGLLLVVLASAAQAQQVESQPKHTRVLVVSIPDRKLALLEDGVVVKVYPVAVGADVSPSPEVDFQIINRLEHPGYYGKKKKKVIAPGRKNPLGTRWMGLDKKSYGIHGTNEEDSIGKAASHGCIRMHRRDLEQLFAMVHVGDKVQIRAERDEYLAQIFGDGADHVQVAAVNAAAKSTGE